MVVEGLGTAILVSYPTCAWWMMLLDMKRGRGRCVGATSRRDYVETGATGQVNQRRAKEAEGGLASDIGGCVGKDEDVAVW